MQLHALLAEVAAAGIDHLALEASSHGLDQHRLDGVRLSAAAFTNLSRDHFDYHGSFAGYLAAKRRLFSELLPSEGVAVLNADQPEYAPLAEVCRARGIAVLDYGWQAERLQLRAQTPDADGQELRVALDGREHRVRLALVGGFQAANAAGRARPGCGHAARIPRLRSVRSPDCAACAAGCERVARHPNGAQVFVDYAHTPDALAQALRCAAPACRRPADRACSAAAATAIRASGPLMGQVAAARADQVFVTDDNPRSEDPAAIRRAILAGCPGALEIGDRRAAIRAAVAALDAGDVLLVAGKGHESGQIVGDRVLPFDDAAEVAGRAGRAGRGGGMSRELWRAAEIAAATGGRGAAATGRSAGVSIDSRTVGAGRAVHRPARPATMTATTFVRDALARGAAALVDHVPAGLTEQAPLVVVDDTMAALTALGRAARAPHRAHGSPRSPAASARPAPRRRCASRSPRRRRPMPARRATTTTGACRSASPARRATRPTASTSSA